MTVNAVARPDDHDDTSSNSLAEVEADNSNGEAAAGLGNSNNNNKQNLDSVVQRLIHKKMGRRKQNCPQKTGKQPPPERPR